MDIGKNRIVYLCSITQSGDNDVVVHDTVERWIIESLFVCIAVGNELCGNSIIFDRE